MWRRLGGPVDCRRGIRVSCLSGARPASDQDRGVDPAIAPRRKFAIIGADVVQHADSTQRHHPGKLLVEISVSRTAPRRKSISSSFGWMCRYDTAAVHLLRRWKAHRTALVRRPFNVERVSRSETSIDPRSRPRSGPFHQHFRESPDREHYQEPHTPISQPARPDAREPQFGKDQAGR